MLFLIFSLDRDRYALDAEAIREILPLPTLKRLPATPAWVAGMASDAEGSYPVIDLAALALARPARRVMSTRLAVVHYPRPNGMVARLGVIVERATSTLRAEAAAFEPLGIGADEAPYLGPVLRTGQGVIQRIQITDLLPEAVRERLFPEVA